MSTPSASELPLALTSLPHWVGWRTESRAGSTKPTKVPYNLATGHKARSNRSEDWIPFPDPADVPPDYDGIGFVFNKDAGLTGIDLDDCLLPDGQVKSWAKSVLEGFPYTYSEISPSGTGIKIWARATLPGSGRKVFVDPEGAPTVESMSDGAIEMYDSGRFFAVTGRALGSLDIAAQQPEVDKLCEYLGGRPATAPTPLEGEPVTEGHRHNYLLSVGGRLRNQGFDRDTLLVSLQTLNNSKCSPPKPERELTGIIEFLMGKPAKYRLLPSDVVASRLAATPPDTPASQPIAATPPDTPASRTADGTIIEFPQPAAVPVPDSSDILIYTENLLTAAITSKKSETILGIGTEPSELIRALAQAGSIKQHEAKRRIKDAKLDIPLREFDARVKAAEVALKPVVGGSQFILNSEGGMVANLANAMAMLNELPLQYNSFTCRPFLTARSPWETWGNWTDYDDAKATEWCQKKLLNVEVRVVAAAADTVARSRRPTYHPVQEYLCSLRHDGTARIDDWMVKYLGARPDDYVTAVSRKWLISAIKRVMEPGCQADYTLVLEGQQGKRKSSALRALCGEWFSDDIADMGTKDSAMQLQGKWIVELAELDAFRRAEMTTIKAWLVRREDHFRPPYGRRADDFPRQNVFAASTNKEDWGLDDTGLRRFWPVKVGAIDVDGLTVARDQIWAEAMFAYTEGELSYLSEGVEVMAGKEQHARQDQDAWKDAVEEWASAPSGHAYLKSTHDCVYLSEVLQYCLGIQKKDWNNPQKARVTRILRLAGYTVKRASTVDANGKRPEYWIKL